LAPLAHAGGWFGDPLLLVVLTATSTLYAGAVISLGRSGAGPGGWRVAAFSIGMAGVFGATMTPLEAAAGESLSAHMIQHMILIAFAAPLLAFGSSPARLSAALPPQVRRWSVRLGTLATEGSSAFLVLAACLILHTATVWIWHIPVLYEGAVGNRWIHGLEHFTFLTTGLVFWWSALAFGTVSKPSLAAATGLFLIAAQGAALGAIMAFSGNVWYPVYAVDTNPGAALSDQQVAGLIMWAFGAAAPASAVALSVIAWINRLDRFPKTDAPMPVPGVQAPRNDC
jgi:putative membrane protein